MIKLVKRGRGLMIHENNKPFIMKLNISIPFGIEIYNNNMIVNLSLDQRNNDDINTLTEYINKENEIINLVPSYIKESRDRITNIRSNNYFRNIRTYLSKKKNERPSITKNMLNIKCTATIKLSSIWTSKTCYGIMINLIDLEKID